MFTLRVFTRKPTGKNYPAALGNSVHFAVCSDGKISDTTMIVM